MTKLAQAFELLDTWRHLPAYQLERRADVFFALYLREIVEQHTGVALSPTIIPELPIKRDLIWPDTPSNQTVKVDYALFAADGSRVFFVELKTDQSSRRGQQDEYLARAQRVGFRTILVGLVEVTQHTKAFRKYHHLLHHLATLGFLKLPDDIEEYLYPKSRPGLTERLRAIEVAAGEPSLDVIYVQPRAEGAPDCIGFDAIAEHVRGYDDGLSQLFAEHLLRWQEDAAARPPA